MSDQIARCISLTAGIGPSPQPVKRATHQKFGDREFSGTDASS